MSVRIVLPRSKVTAKRSSMRGSLISLFLFFSVLLGASGIPSMVHIHDGLGGQAIEFAEINNKALESPDNSSKSSNSLPTHAAHHHHGTDAVYAADDKVRLSCVSGCARQSIPLAALLYSLNRAPPTQPPSA